MKIFVDIDSTLTDFANVLLETLNAHYNKSYAYTDITYWNWFTDTFGSNCFFPLRYDSFWDSVTIDPTAVKVIESMVLSGNEVYLCTASAFTPSLGHKIQTTLKPFNPDILSEKNVIVCEDKWLLAGKDRVLIDDRASNVNQFVLNGGHGIVFNQPWNMNFTLANRANSWEEIGNYMRSMKK